MNEEVEFLVTSDETGGEVAVIDVTISPGGGPPMLHRHDPFELYRVHAGELTVYLGGGDGTVTRTVAGPGSSIPIGAGVEHTIRNESDQLARATALFSPGQTMEGFARAIADRAETSPEDVLALAESHGIEITRSIDDALADVGARGSAPRKRDHAYLSIARFAGDPDRLLEDYRAYNEVMSGVGRDHGLILHAGAKTADGVLIVNLWPSQDCSEAAAADPRRLEVIGKISVAPEAVSREHHDVVNVELFD